MSDALQAALAGEYAAIYGYGRAGARLRQQDVALLELERHRTARDQLRAWLVESGQEPLPPAPAYVVDPVGGDRAARVLLATIELRLIPLYTEVVADQMDDPEHRAWAIRAVRDCALSAQAWGGAGQAFPWPSGVAGPL